MTFSKNIALLTLSDELKGLLVLPGNIVLGLTIAFGFVGGVVMMFLGVFLTWKA